MSPVLILRKNTFLSLACAIYFVLLNLCNSALVMKFTRMKNDSTTGISLSLLSGHSFREKNNI